MSMYPTISDGGDILFYERVSRRLKLKSRLPRRGSVVLANSPEDDCIVCKRVVGLEGDLIWAEAYRAEYRRRSGEEAEKVLVVIPENCVWLRGDNESTLPSTVEGSLTLDRLCCYIWL